MVVAGCYGRSVIGVAYGSDFGGRRDSGRLPKPAVPPGFHERMSQHGPAGSTLSGTIPMKVNVKLGNAIYYSLTAQLQGGGRVTVKILINGKVISESNATGGYNIATAEISQDPLTGEWTDTNSPS
jgi:hypothetical protein